MTNQELFNLIWAECERKGLAQVELARHLGISESLLCNWKYGRRVPKIVSLRKLAKLAGLVIAVTVWRPR